MEEAFAARLKEVDSELEGEFIKLMEYKLSEFGCELDDVFAEGFRFGAAMIMEILCD